MELMESLNTVRSDNRGTDLLKLDKLWNSYLNEEGHGEVDAFKVFVFLNIIFIGAIDHVVKTEF